jgi:hypothetical protein
MKKAKRVLQGFRYESLAAKIRYMLSLPLAERYSQGLVKGRLAKILERNYQKLYGRHRLKHIQILKQT